MPLAIICGCTARFVSDLVGNPEPVFSERGSYIVCANNKGADQTALSLFAMAYKQVFSCRLEN